jgi:hypothetical protein
MKKVLLLLLVLLLPVAFAEISTSSDTRVDFTIKPSYTFSDANITVTAILNPTSQNYTKGHLYNFLYIAMPSAPVTPTGGGGGGWSYSEKKSGVVNDYLIQLVSARNAIRPDDNVKVRVYIYNFKTVAGENLKLLTYLKSPNETIYKEKYVNVPLVQPVCVNGTYRAEYDDCFYNGKIYPAKPTMVEVETAIPLDKIKTGSWLYYVELIFPYTTSRAVAYIRFRLLSLLNYFVIVLFIIFIIVYFIYKKKKRKKKQVKNENKR